MLRFQTSFGKPVTVYADDVLAVVGETESTCILHLAGGQSVTVDCSHDQAVAAIAQAQSDDWDIEPVEEPEETIPEPAAGQDGG